MSNVIGKLVYNEIHRLQIKSFANSLVTLAS